MQKTWRVAVVAAIASVVAATPTIGAQTIFSGQSAVVNSGGTEGSGSISWTHDGSGLSTPYVPNVTNFDTYIASNPLHTILYAPNEWFSLISSTAVVTYDFGSVRSYDRFALWNEEFSGIGSINILGSVDGSSFTTILSGLNPPNSPQGVDYGATVWSFATTTSRYFRLEMSQCPQAAAMYDGCSIGEVAFRSATPSTVVPEPGSVVMMASGLLALAGFAVRRRQR